MIKILLVTIKLKFRKMFFMCSLISRQPSINYVHEVNLPSFDDSFGMNSSSNVLPMDRLRLRIGWMNSCVIIVLSETIHLI